MSQIRTIDEILDWQTHLIVKESILQNVSESKKINITEEMMLEAKAEAKQAIKDYIAKEIIGPDEPEPEIPHNDYYWRFRNEFRSTQRQRLEKE